MFYEKPEAVVLGLAASVIQSNKPHISETSIADPAPPSDAELAD